MTAIREQEHGIAASEVAETSGETGDNSGRLSAVTTACAEACVANQQCIVCRRRKAPMGRSVPLEMCNSLCDWECSGYLLDPKPGHLWPGEGVSWPTIR